MEQQKFFFPANLKRLRNRLKMSQDDLAEKLGIKRSKLAALEKGVTINPTVEDLLRFSDFYKVTIDTLLRVDLSGLPELKLRELLAGNDIYVKGKNLRILATTITPDNKEQVEMVTLKAKAGYAAGYGDPDYIAQLPVFHMPNLPTDRKFRMFPVSGDSMLPVPEGAYVIVEYLQDWTTVKDGTPCIVITKNDGIVFKIVDNRIKENETLLLTSLNPAYKPYEIPVSEVLELWKYHSYWTEQTLEPATTADHILIKIEEVRQEVTALAQKL